MVVQDNALATLVVRQPASVGGKLQLMEMRNSPLAPFLFMAWLDPVTGASVQMPLPDDWWQNWEVDPQIFAQWPGSTRRVWSYDYVNNYAWFKLYDEVHRRVVGGSACCCVFVVRGLMGRGVLPFAACGVASAVQCGGQDDDCDESEALVALAWVPPVYVDWYVAVEPVEPELTQVRCSAQCVPLRTTAVCKITVFNLFRVTDDLDVH